MSGRSTPEPEVPPIPNPVPDPVPVISVADPNANPVVAAQQQIADLQALINQQTQRIQAFQNAPIRLNILSVNYYSHSESTMVQPPQRDGSPNSNSN
jgi:hypothetical protein